MRGVIEEIAAWQQQGDAFALATVVETSSSAPRRPGATMAVHPDGFVRGNVSGGCVEAAVIGACHEALHGAPPKSLTFGYSEDEAFSVGLTCGGTIRVFVRVVRRGEGANLAALRAEVANDRPVAIASVVHAPAAIGISMLVRKDGIDGDLGHNGLNSAVVQEARGLLTQGASGLRYFGEDGSSDSRAVEVFIQCLASRPQLLVFGAVDFASALVNAGRLAGFRVTVCDAREVFATPARFPSADEVVVEWPHRFLDATTVDNRAAICVLTHDPKFDVPAILSALRTDASYIGVMGSRRTHDQRLERLRAAGVTEAEIERLRSPIGLDLGARSPEETAFSIIAEIIMDRWGGSGQPLSHTKGPIHH